MAALNSAAPERVQLRIDIDIAQNLKSFILEACGYQCEV